MMSEPEFEEREEREFERLFAVLREEPSMVGPDLREHVMRRVRALASSPWRRAAAWATTPATVRISPLAASLALAATVAAIVLLQPGARLPEDGATAMAAAEGSVTRFVFFAPNARSVAVTGDFVDWDPDGVPLRDPQGTGVWVAELEVRPGLHHYVFIVDGTEWRPDPNATQVDDGFGQRNSVLLVPPRSPSRGA